MKFLDFEAHILVDGVELPEYDVTYDENKKEAFCWIPSEAGKSFSISGKTLKPFGVDLTGDIYVDGAFIVGNIFQKNHSSQTATWRGLWTSNSTVKPFVFNNIELTDDETYSNRAASKDLGNIIVMVKHIELGGDATFTAKHLMTEEKVHERSKKAISHKIGFGAEIASPLLQKQTKVKVISTICALTFRYRSIDILRADGIAPPVPKAASNSDKRKASDGLEEHETSDEVAQDEARVKALLKELHSLEAKIAKNNPRKKVKTEHGPAPFIPGEVIDLT